MRENQTTGLKREGRFGNQTGMLRESEMNMTCNSLEGPIKVLQYMSCLIEALCSLIILGSSGMRVGKVKVKFTQSGTTKQMGQKVEE